jgi:hypothetical protein
LFCAASVGMIGGQGGAMRRGEVGGVCVFFGRWDGQGRAMWRYSIGCGYWGFGRGDVAVRHEGFGECRLSTER